MPLSESFFFISWICASLQSVDGVVNDNCQFDNCNVTKTKLQICKGSDTYIPNYPSTYNRYLSESLKLKPTLTFLNLADFDPDEKIVTVFVSLMLEWNDTRLSLNTYE